MTYSDDALNRYLDALAMGTPVTSDQLDPELAETIHRLSELGRNPEPHPGFVDQLEERLMNAVSDVPVVPLSPIRISRPGAPWVVPSRAARSTRGSRRWSPILIAAALILAVLGVAWRTFDPAGPRRNPQVGAPAIQAPATPSPGASRDQTLLEVTLPVDVVPVGEDVNVLLARDTIPANSVTTHAPMDCCAGTKTYHILAGMVSFVSDGPVQRIRHGGGGRLEEIAPGKSVELVPGDSLVVRNEHHQTWTTGTEPVDIITTAVASGFWMTSFDPIEWVGNGSASNSQMISLPAGPYLLRIQRKEISEDATFPPTAGTIIQFGLTSDGTGVGQSSDQTLSVKGVRGHMSVFILSLEVAPEGVGTPVPGVRTVQSMATSSP
jgi:hypothetical protein